MAKNQRLKAIILCAGRGIRLKPITNTIAKHLLPIANRPILYYVLDKIEQSGISDIGIIVSPENEEQIREKVKDGYNSNIHLTYILQNRPAGLAHAVKTAREFLGDSSFLMFLGDNLIDLNIEEFINEFHNHSPEALILLKEVADPRPFGVAELDISGNLADLVEKPKDPNSNFAIVGAYLFTNKIHEAIDHIEPSWRGELEITDAVQWLLKNNRVVRSHTLKGWWLDIGNKDSLLKANRIFLDGLLEQHTHRCVYGNRIEGQVEIKEGSQLTNSTIKGPVSIAEYCHINNSSIGPYSSIGARTIIEGSSMENSIILDNCHIHNRELLNDSIIGTNGQIILRDNQI